MPRKGSPYDYAYKQRRKRLLARKPTCWFDGCDAVATEVDHDPPLALHEHHIPANGRKPSCCREMPACAKHQRQQGGELRAAQSRGLRAEIDDEFARAEFVEPDGIPADDPCWRVPWLLDLLDVPEDATWPRFMTAPHPDAVGSYGAELEDWMWENRRIKYRWWQRLALRRILEHDADGVLVWLSALVTTARQVGKSYLASGWCTDRLMSAERFGEPQLVLHTGKDLPVCKEVQRLARVWAREAGLYVRDQNGNEEIATHAPKDPDAALASRWLVRGKDSTYGYSASGGFGDEVWAILAAVIEDGMEGTQLERRSPQTVLTSTAHRKATSLFVERRIIALGELRDPMDTLLLEWSAPRWADLGDVDAWRMASPSWTAGRERLLRARYRKVLKGETFDRDEEDPAEAFRAQYLNIWPLVTIGPSGGEPLFGEGEWEAAAGERQADLERVWVAVADNYGKGAAVGVVARLSGGGFEVDGWTCESRAAAFASVDSVVAAFAECAPKRLLHAAIPSKRSDERFGAAELARGLSALRAARPDLVHDDTIELDGQVRELRVRQSASGALTIVSGARCDIVRAVAAAMTFAESHRGVGVIHTPSARGPSVGTGGAPR